jgi:site-specific recombinase XerD
VVALSKPRLAIFLEDHMAALPEATSGLFPSLATQSGHPVEIRKPFRRVVRAAGLDPDEVVRHTLRHTAITYLVQARVDLPTVKRISEHKPLIMVECYAHQNDVPFQATMDALEPAI